MRGCFMAVCAALLVAAPAGAGIENAGTTAANFLSVGTGPATLAMGGAAIGRSGSLDLTSWNVGSLGFLREGGLMLSHANLDDQTAQEWLAFGGRFGSMPTRWAITGLYQNEGTFEGRDASNNPTGTFSAASTAVGAQVAHAITPNIALGVGGKWVNDRLGDAATGSGIAFDAGLSLRFGAWGLGAAAQNAFGSMTYDGTSYPFPTSYGGGVSYTHALSGVTAAVDLNVPDADYTNVRGGIEWQYKHAVALRAGYRADMGSSGDDGLAGPTFGMGAGLHGMWLDYGFLLQGAGGGQHRMALTFRPGMLNASDLDDASEPTEPRPAPRAAVRPPEPEAKPAKASRDEDNVPAAKPAHADAAPAVSAPAAAAPAKPEAAPSKGSPLKPAKAAKPEAATMGTGARIVSGARRTVANSKSAPAPTAPSASPSAPAPEAQAAPKPAEATEDKAKPASGEATSVKPEAASEAKAEAADAKETSKAKDELSDEEKSYEPPAPKVKGKKGKPAVAPAEAAPTKRPEKVTVRHGETMRDIAARWGTSAAAIMMENNLVREDVKNGQVLRLPKPDKR